MKSVSLVPDFLSARLKELPAGPGVYIFRDRSGAAVYIGKALSVKKRVAGHFRFYGKDTSKEGVMLSHVHRVDVMETPSEAEALLLEAALVKERMPKYNSLLRDDKSYPFLKITGEEYPRLLVVRNRKSDGGKYFGPYTSVYLLRQAVNWLRREFPLRTCKSLPKKVCLMYHIGQCGGPCEANQSKESYMATVKELENFLLGKRDALVRNLTKRMRAHSAAKEFEKAQQLLELVRALSSVPSSGPPRGADVLAEAQKAFSLPSLPRRMECFDISNIHGKEAVGSMVVFIDGKPARSEYRRFRVRTVQGIDDYRMMREVVGRRYRRRLEEKAELPDLVVIDGGKGHLAAAKKELDEMGLQDLPVVSIAKQRELVFKPDREEPYVLSASSPALHMIRHLRDEAHRFAIRYHRNLHRKAAFAMVAFLLFSAGLFFSPHAQADMIEAEGSIYNGKIVSQDDKEIRFRDGAGQERVFAKTSVSYVDIDQGSSTGAGAPQAEGGILKEVRKRTSEPIAAAKKAAKALQESSKGLTKKATGKLSKPLDRSGANAKSKKLADAMGDYGKNTQKLAAKEKKIQAEIKKNEKFECAMRSGKSASEEAISGKSSGGKKKGRFRSL